MVEKSSEQSIMDKSMRSVFVGNIPYGATEENLKEIFSEVGPVISLKLVYDRESGKPKGYGFCEYKDQETALSAMRNLNNYEIGGRTLRVDNACTEKSRMEMQQLLQASQVENPYGDYCEADNAPEAITKTVASLPPEQMYELMRQMKACIQNNPTEARQMLLLNPQLAYALLQAQVVMRIIDPQTALTMLYKANQIPPVLTSSTMQLPPVVQQHQIGNQSQNSVSNITQPLAASLVPTSNNNFTAPNQQDIDLRSISADPRIQQQQQRTNLDLDMRSSNSNPIQSNHSNVMDTRNANMNNPRPVPPPPSLNVQQQQQQQPFPTDPRQRPVDPRIKIAAQQQQQSNSVSSQPLPVSAPQLPLSLSSSSSSSSASSSLTQQQQQPNALSMSNTSTAVPIPSATSVLSGTTTTTSAHHRIPAGVGIPHDASDQEKAALIMQVLQLSEEQIAMLPPEQRASILVLKEQIAKSTR